MKEPATETRSVVVEREMPFQPEKIWRALTQPHLIEEWLMKNDFAPVVGHRFNVSARLGLRRLSGPDARSAEDALLHLGHQGSEKCRHVDPHAHRHGHPPAHGADRLPRISGSITAAPRLVGSSFFAKLEDVLGKLE